MKPGYEPVFSLIAHSALVAARRHERAEIMRMVMVLAAAPFSAGDLTESDDTGRTLQVIALSNYVLTYWADHAVRELRIVKLERVSG
jgi:hypothetical protein